MITKETIDELKSKQPAIFAAKMAVLKDEQVVATVMMSQIEHDRNHPPEEAALARLASAQAVVLAHAGRLALSREEFRKLVEEVRAEFPDIEIKIIELPTDSGDAGAMLEELRKYQARIEELEDAVDEQTKTHVMSMELIDQLNANAAIAAARIVELEKLLESNQAPKDDVERNAAIAAFEAKLEAIGKCSSIKEVRELLKPVEAQAEGQA